MMGVAIAFYGADHKCGTSMISQCFAQYVAAKYKDSKVLLIHTENGEGEEYSPCVHESLETIRPYLAEKLVDTVSVMEKSRYKDNLFIIGGAARPGTASMYHPDMAQYLIASFSEHFDFVICDAGSEIEHGMAIGSLYASDYAYSVLTQDEYAVRRLEWVRPMFNKINLQLSGIVVNKFSEDEVNNPELIALRTGMSQDRLFCIRFSKNGKRAQLDNQTLLDYKDKRFYKDFVKFAEAVLKEWTK